MPRFPHEGGGYGEYVTAPSRHFAHIPDGVDDVTAAATPLAALTAWQVLVDAADVQRDQRVLIHAAGGGVGHLAVQIAKTRGAHIVGTASAGKHAYLVALGLDEAIDHHTEEITEAEKAPRQEKEKGADVIDLMSLLKKSVEHKSKPAKRSARKRRAA